MRRSFSIDRSIWAMVCAHESLSGPLLPISVRIGLVSDVVGTEGCSARSSGVCTEVEAFLYSYISGSAYDCALNDEMPFGSVVKIWGG